MKRNKGFTLIELILVIAILGILAISALPKFMDLSSQAKTSSMQGVVGAVRAGVALYKANKLANGETAAYPTTLDAVADATACSTTAECFSSIMEQGVTDGKWTKVNSTQYTYNIDNNLSTYNYSSTNGTFK